MRPFTTTCLMLAAAVCPAQAPDLRAVPLAGSKKDDLALPLIVSSATPSAAARLNAFLQLTYLDGLAKPGMKDPFSRVRYDFNRDGSGSTSSLSWSASSQGRLLAIQIAGESMGAYPTETVDDLLVDCVHGQPVAARDLFTPEGLKALGARLATLRKAKLRQTIQSEQRGKPDGDVQDCITVQQDALKEQAFDRVQDLRLDAKAMAFPASLDLPHALLVCDVDLTIALPRAELAPYLSVYGKGLLDSALPAPALPSAWASRVFTGRIGAAPVVLHLTRDADGTLGGAYAYAKQGAAIELSGTMKDGGFEAQESAANGDITGRLAFRENGVQLQGAWTSPDGKRSLPFTASAE